MNADEIRPGMIGVGRTVFEGTRVEEFKVNILGVLDNIFGTAPQPDSGKASKAARWPTPASSPA